MNERKKIMKKWNNEKMKNENNEMKNEEKKKNEKWNKWKNEIMKKMKNEMKNEKIMKKHWMKENNVGWQITLSIGNKEVSQLVW